MKRSHKMVRNDSIDISKELESIRKDNIKKMFENEIDYFTLEKNIHIFNNSNQFPDLDERKNQLSNLLKILNDPDHSYENERKKLNQSQNLYNNMDSDMNDNMKYEKEDDKKSLDHEIINDYTEIVPTETDTDIYHNNDLEDNSKSYLNNESTNDSNNGRIIKSQSNPLLIFKVSSKMKLSEIQEVANKLSIIIEKDSKSKSGKRVPKTKSELLSEINQTIENNKT